MNNATKKTLLQSGGSKWIMAKSNGEPAERLIVNAFKKALCIYESEGEIDRYIARNPELAALGCFGTKKRISLAAAIEVLQRRTDCELVSVNWIPDAENDVIVSRVEYLDNLERQLGAN